jgi:flagellar biosynthetic protein FliP
MFRQTRTRDINLFMRAAKLKSPRSKDEVPTSLLIPAFVMSEMKTGFEMGFALFISFLIVDMAVASILMSLGMMMIPPMSVSLPLKILLFVLADGWFLVAKSLIESVR